MKMAVSLQAGIILAVAWWTLQGVDGHAGRAFSVDAHDFAINLFQELNPNIKWSRFLVNLAGRHATCNIAGRRGGFSVKRLTREGATISGVDDFTTGDRNDVDPVEGYIMTMMERWRFNEEYKTQITYASEVGCSVRPRCGRNAMLVCLFSPGYLVGERSFRSFVPPRDEFRELNGRRQTKQRNRNKQRRQGRRIGKNRKSPLVGAFTGRKTEKMEYEIDNPKERRKITREERLREAKGTPRERHDLESGIPLDLENRDDKILSDKEQDSAFERDRLQERPGGPQRSRERQRELERRRELEIKYETERRREMERQQKERDRELERQKGLERTNTRDRDLERRRELEREEEFKRDIERERYYERQRELERQREIERDNELDKDRERLRELQRQEELERETEREREQARQWQLRREELEREQLGERDRELQIERERARLLAEEREAERQREIEYKREMELKAEQERLARDNERERDPSYRYTDRSQTRALGKVRAFTSEQYDLTRQALFVPWDMSHLLENLSGMEASCDMITRTDWRFSKVTPIAYARGLNIRGLYGSVANRGSTQDGIWSILSSMKSELDTEFQVRPQMAGCCVIPDCDRQVPDFDGNIRLEMTIVVTCLFQS